MTEPHLLMIGGQVYDWVNGGTGHCGVLPKLYEGNIDMSQSDIFVIWYHSDYGTVHG